MPNGFARPCPSAFLYPRFRAIAPPCPLIRGGATPSPVSLASEGEAAAQPLIFFLTFANIAAIMNYGSDKRLFISRSLLAVFKGACNPLNDCGHNKKHLHNASAFLFAVVQLYKTFIHFV